jgi:hypothetical protein
MTVKLNNDNDFQRWTDRRPTRISVLHQLAVACKVEAECYYQTLCRLTVKYSGITNCDNTQPVMRHPMTNDSAKIKRYKLNRNANASAKSKEVQLQSQDVSVAAHLLLPQRTTTFTNRH